jgi:SPP1 gp7 family putative phage head morphogenesis protein
VLRPHHRTAAVVRLLRAAAPAMHRRTRGRLPRQQQPDGLRLEYYKAIRVRFVEPALRAFAVERAEVVRLLESTRKPERADAKEENKKPYKVEFTIHNWKNTGETKTYTKNFGSRETAEKAVSESGIPARIVEKKAESASDEEKRARELVDRAARRAAEALSGRELHAAAEQFGKRTSDFQKAQIDRQVRQAVGVPFSALESPTRDRIPGFVQDNVSLIKSIGDRYFDSLRAEVSQAFESGEHPETFAQRLADRDGVALSDARRIARDQIGKLNAQVNQDRQEAMGVTGYTWRGAMDNRERDEHRDREGKHYDWDDPPEGGHPGEPVMCRCVAEPDFNQVKEAVSEEE